MNQVQAIKSATVSEDLHPLIRERWSPRTFQDRTIEEGVIEQLFEAARWAASSNNAQPWRFIYAHRGSAAYDKMFDCLSGFNQKWANNAPLLALTAIKEKFDNGKENYHALHDLGLALGNFTMQAQQSGIAVHHMAGVDWKKTHEKFSVPAGYHVVSALAVGYYGGKIDKLSDDLQESEVAARKRKELTQIVAKDHWPEG